MSMIAVPDSCLHHICKYCTHLSKLSSYGIPEQHFYSRFLVSRVILYVFLKLE